ncbi:MAG TPA: BrnA antitoxin family protein [Azospirillaceae bacterium]|nr:BrnA antitoxin family protein [Azospirillaceae bacterium]
MASRKPADVSDEDWKAVDSPGLTDGELAGMRPAAEVVPGLAAAFRRTRGPQKAPTKVPVTLRLDRDVVDHFRSQGEGWQTRMNEALRRSIGK